MHIKETAESILITIFQILVFLLKSIWITLKASIFAFIPKTKKSLENEIMLITGAGRGVGRQLAKDVARLGAHVVLWDLDEHSVRQASAEIKDEGGRSSWFVCDVTNEMEVQKKAKEVEETVGEVTILVNNAGIMQNLPIMKLDSNRIRLTLNVNTLAHFWTIRAFLPKMERKNRGHIVAISSAAGLMGHVNQSDYSASKHAVVGLMEALSEELRLRSVDVKLTTICPVTIDTGMNQNPITKSLLMPILSIEAATAQIVNAIRREDYLVTLPRSTQFLLALTRLFPRQVLSEFLDLTDYCRVSNVDNTHISETKGG